MHEPALTSFITDKLLPNWTKDLTDTELPTCIMPKQLAACIDPNINLPCTDKWLPHLTTPLIEIVLPKCVWV
jgi:hypothetical protein